MSFNIWGPHTVRLAEGEEHPYSEALGGGVSGGDPYSKAAGGIPQTVRLSEGEGHPYSEAVRWRRAGQGLV